jgi:hypothetical protein
MKSRLLLSGVLLYLLSSFGTLSAYYIWPVDSPIVYPGDSSVQHDVSGAVGEYRETGHFHGGVDIAEPNYSDVYSVRGDYNYVVSEGSLDRVAIREWYTITGGTWLEAMDGLYDEWATHWYVHIDDLQVQYQDLILRGGHTTPRLAGGNTLVTGTLHTYTTPPLPICTSKKSITMDMRTATHSRAVRSGPTSSTRCISSTRLWTMMIPSLKRLCSMCRAVVRR